MKAVFERVFGYQGDNMNLPVRNVAEAVPFYETMLGFRAVSRTSTPQNAVVLARDQIQMRLAENGGDPTQDGCAFQVKGLEALLTEFRANGLHKELSETKTEQRNGAVWNVFYIVAPDGLCYWFGERQVA